MSALAASGGCGGWGQMTQRSRSATPRGLPSISCCTVAVKSTVDGLQPALMRGAGGVSLCI